MSIYTYIAPPKFESSQKSHLIYMCYVSLTFDLPVTHSHVLSQHMWMRHVTHEWVMAHIIESWHIWMSHVTCAWIMAHVNESCHTQVEECYFKGNNALDMKESCHVWVTAHVNESCHTWLSRGTYEWAMSHVNESRHMWPSHGTSEWAKSHIGVKVLLEKQ